MKQTSLDQLYQMTAYIYSEQNAIRPVAATFAHFVEVCGMLTIHDRRKKKEGLDFVDALCKALGWYFPLLAKLKVRSVEELIFRKYPFVCPYCRKAPHEDSVCKTVRGTAPTVNHDSLRKAYDDNLARKPVGIDEWQAMFQKIYPRSMDDRARSTLGLFEELGELSEAVRVFERYPKYFAGEAADTFSYLMGIANEFSLRQAQDNGNVLSLQDEYLKRFPGLCIGCGHRVCVCPSIPRSTVGRMSKELDIVGAERLFDQSDDGLLSGGRLAASSVLQSVGGVRKIAEGFPADRGDANVALISLCLKLSTVVETTNPAFAERLLSAAIELGGAPAEAGSRRGEDFLLRHQELLSGLRDVLRGLSSDGNISDSSLQGNPIAFDLGVSLRKLRLLLVLASPRDETSLRISGELRVIRQAIELGGRQSEMEIDDLPAATVDDLRRALLKKNYEILHFAGHSDSQSIVLESESGDSLEVPLSNLASQFRRYPSIRCVVLNSCESLATFDRPLAPYTVGMTAPITDEAAIEFARGFYDAISRGKSIEFSVEEGKHAAQLKGLEAPQIKLLADTEILDRRRKT